MKNLTPNIIPDLQQHSIKINLINKLLWHEWILIDESPNIYSKFIFKNKRELLISSNGVIEAAEWEYLGNQSITIKANFGEFLYKIFFHHNDIFKLRLDGSTQDIYLVNETIFNENLNSTEKINNYLITEKQKAETINKNIRERNVAITGILLIIALNILVLIIVSYFFS